MTTPFYEDNHIRIFNKDCRDMTELPNESVQCVCTSPPYWGLRKYSGDQDLIWGGDKGCEHQWGERKITRRGHPGTKSTLVGTQTAELSKAVDTLGSVCILCGAWKCGYGLEPTPEMYVQHTIEILREIRRVLRKDGVVFLNIGDSYASGKGSCFNPGGGEDSLGKTKKEAGAHPLHRGNISDLRNSNLKPKDLCLIPFRIALEAQKPYQEFTIKELSDRAWLAGIVDADGTIGIHHLERDDRGNHYHQFQPFIAVGSSDLSMVERCVAITRFGGSRQKIEPNTTDSRGIVSNRPHHEWRLEGEKAIKVIQDIYPYLIVKERQARIAYELYNCHQPHSGKGHKVPEDITNKKLSLWNLCKVCNQREEVDINLPPVPQHIEPGWWLRSVIIWNKPNPMPESVKDRPTESHEYILMLTKSARYYWDQEAVRELSGERSSGNKGRKYRRDYGGPEAHTGRQGFSIPYEPNGTGRNIRSVWEFPTVPFPGIRINGRKVSPFAVFPEKLPEICIKAATPEVGCCSKCGAPWTRVIKKGFTDHDGATRTSYPEGSSAKRLALLRQAARGRGAEYQNVSETIAWRPTCNCNAPRVPSLVLDPMMGAGTTLLVAKKLNRFAVGYELSEEYCQLAVERCQQQMIL